MQHHRGVGVAHGRQPADDLEQFRQGPGARGPNLDQVGGGAGHVMDFLNAGDGGELFPGVEGANGFLGLDEGERGEVEGDGGRIDAGFVAGHHAPAFELAHAFQHGRRGHGHGPGDIGVGGAGIFLKDHQDFSVDIVDHSFLLLVLWIKFELPRLVKRHVRLSFGLGSV